MIHHSLINPALSRPTARNVIFLMHVGCVSACSPPINSWCPRVINRAKQNKAPVLPSHLAAHINRSNAFWHGSLSQRALFWAQPQVMMCCFESEGKARVHRIMISCSLFENKSITRNPFGVHSSGNLDVEDEMVHNNQNQKGISAALSGTSAQPLSVSCSNNQEHYETMEVVHLFVLATRQVSQRSSKLNIWHNVVAACKHKLFTYCVIAVKNFHWPENPDQL